MLSKFKATLLILVLTCLPLQAADKFSFAVFGDVQGNYDSLQKMIPKIKAERDIAFCVNVGDAVSDGKYPDFVKYNRIIKQSGLKIYNVPGNHDTAWRGWQYFRKFFGQYYYSFGYENSKFIVLDNSFSYRFKDSQYNWLTKQLSDNKRQHVFVFMHKPASDPSGFFDKYIMKPDSLAQRLMNLLSDNKVDIVFSGHIHAFQSGKFGNTLIIITGGGGGDVHLPEDMGGFHHYIRVNVEGDKVGYEVRRLN